MKLYTRTGDDGSTGLFGGERVAKDHPRVTAYGTVDELNAALGLAAAAADGTRPGQAHLLDILTQLQSRLFDLGADLATPTDNPHESKIVRIGDDHVAQVEAWIDDVDAQTPELTTFVLPGGTELAARLHMARGIARRAERAVVTLGRTTPITSAAVIHLNRVSDLLFAMARFANAEAGVPDVPWTGPEA